MIRDVVVRPEMLFDDVFHDDSIQCDVPPS